MLLWGKLGMSQFGHQFNDIWGKSIDILGECIDISFESIDKSLRTNDIVLNGTFLDRLTSFFQEK
jgi:hypothetical protein